MYKLTTKYRNERQKIEMDENERQNIQLNDKIKNKSAAKLTINERQKNQMKDKRIM